MANRIANIKTNMGTIRFELLEDEAPKTTENFRLLADYPLPPSYTKFGQVIEGQDVVDAIATAPTGPGDRPLKDVVMEQVTIE